MSNTGDDIRIGARFDVDADSLVSDVDTATRRARAAFEANFRRARENLLHPDQAGGDGAAWERAGRELGADFSAGLRDGAAQSMGRLEQQLEAFQRQIAARQRALVQVGADADIFAGLDVGLQRFMEGMEELRLAQERGFSPEYLYEFRRRLQAELEGLRVDLREVEPAFALLLESARSARSEAVVTGQRELTLTNTTMRTQSQQAVAEMQINARRRIEIMRFVFRQAVFFERQIAAAIRGTASIVGGVVSGIGSGLSRITGLFRRSDNEINDGLRSALSAREQALSRSFRKQEDETRQSYTRQQRAFENYARQQQRSMNSLLSGRSRLGGQLGVGSLVAGLTGGLSGGALVSAGLERFNQMERLNILLTRLTGSAAAGQRALEQFDEAARGSPFALTDVADLGVGFLSIGENVQTATRYVEALLDAVGFVGGGAEELQRVSLAMRQISSAGRLLGQDFNQIAQALPGINLSQILADQLTGGDTQALRKLRESGGISASAFSEAFITGLEQDRRIGGSAAALMDTLAGRASNTRAAFARLGAAIVGAQQDSLMTALTSLRNGLDFLTRFVKGDVGPALMGLRAALRAVFVAMGALAGAKLAVELLQRLRLVLALMATPIGLVVTAIAGLAAAFGALRASNETFRALTDGFRIFASEQISRGIDALAAGVGQLGEFLVRTALPAVVAFGAELANRLIPAFQFVAGFVTGVILPAFQTAFGFVADTVVPAVIDLASAFRGYLVPAAVAVGAALFVALAPMQAIVLAAGAVTAAIVVLRRVSDDFRGFTDNMARMGLDLARGLGNIATTVVREIAPIFAAIGEVIANTFRNIDFGALGKSILSFVNTLGRLLGTALTSRAFINAVSAVTAVAASLAVSFLAGFAEGVIRGLPGAVDQIFKNIAFALDAAGLPEIFGNLFRNSFTAIAAVIISAVVLKTILANFTRLGNAASSAFSDGFGSGLRRSAAGLTGAIRGFVGGTGAYEAAAARNAQAYQKRYDEILRTYSRVGFQSRVDARRITQDLPIDERQLRALEGELQRVERTMGTLTFRASLFRARWGEAFTGLARGEIRQFGRAINEQVQATGGWASAGVKMGGLLLGGFQSVVQGSQGGRSGLVGVLATSLMAGLATGSPLVGAITALAGGLSLLWAEANKGAREAAERVRDFADALRELSNTSEVVETIQEKLNARFEEAFSTGTQLALLNILPEGILADVAADIESGGVDLERQFNQIVGRLNLSAEQLADLRTLMGDSFDFTDLRGGINDLVYDMDAMGNVTVVGARQMASVQAFVDALGEEGLKLNDVSRYLAILAQTQEGYNDGLELALARQRANNEAAAGAASAYDHLTDRYNNWVDATSQPQSFFDFARLRDATMAAFNAAIDDVARFGGSVADVFQTAVRHAQSMGTSIDLGFLQELIDGWIAAGSATKTASQSAHQYNHYLEVLARQNMAQAAAATFNNWKKDLDSLIDQQRELIDVTDLTRSAIDELNRVRTARLQGEVDAITSRLDAARDAADEAREAFTSYITAPYQDTPQALVDDLIGSLDSIGSNIEEAMGQGGLLGAAAMRSAIGDFDARLAGVIQAGFDAGLRSPEELLQLLAPLNAAITETIAESRARILSDSDFTEGITPAAGQKMADALQRVLSPHDLEAAIQAVMDADNEVNRLQAQLDAAQAALEVDVVFSGAQIQEALQAAGLNAAVAATIDFNSIGAQLQQGTGIADQVALANQVTQAGIAAIASGTLPAGVDRDQAINYYVVSVFGAEDPASTAADLIQQAGSNASGGPFTRTNGTPRLIPV